MIPRIATRRGLPPRILLAALALSACGGGASVGGTASPDPALYVDVTADNLPGGLSGNSMDAAVIDADGDGDADLVIAQEFDPNILLINDGAGVFARAPLPVANRDSEDLAVADFDGDGDADIVVVSEDDQVNEFYVNDGAGRFLAAGNRIPVTGVSNAVATADINGDGAPDLLIGNAGQNRLLLGDGAGNFGDATAARLPAINDVTQDVEFGDVDGDGDLDILVGNEDANRLLINDGTGVFADDTAARLPISSSQPEETREADFGDIDGDGDLDILFANVAVFVSGANPRNRLLRNDGAGVFTDVTATQLPADTDNSFDGDFLDIDRDGDADIITANTNLGGVAQPFRVYLNDGSGTYTLSDGGVLPPGTDGNGFDALFFDANGDGRGDLYLSSRGRADRLLLARP